MPTLKQLRDVASGSASVRGQQRPAIGRPLTARVAAIVLFFAVSGCVSAGGGPVSDHFWREDLGRLNQATIEEALAKIIQKHGLRLEQRYDEGSQIRWELGWIPREVVAEEEVRGITNARNRILIKGVQSGAANVDNYRMTWELANEVTSMANSNWHPDIVPASVIEEFRPVFTDMRLEVRTGVRR